MKGATTPTAEVLDTCTEVEATIGTDEGPPCDPSAGDVGDDQSVEETPTTLIGPDYFEDAGNTPDSWPEMQTDSADPSGGSSKDQVERSRCRAGLHPRTTAPARLMCAITQLEDKPA